MYSMMGQVETTMVQRFSSQEFKYLHGVNGLTSHIRPEAV